MIPGTITPHPDAPDAYILMKAPPGMDNCVDLGYRIVQVDGRYAIVAEFNPTLEEIAGLVAGRPLRFMMTLLLDAEQHPIVPPIALWVRDEDEV